MGYSVLSSTEVEQFMESGYLLLREAFPREVAAQGRAVLWREFGLDENDPATWTKPYVRLERGYSDPPFSHAFTPRVLGAYDDLLGRGRYEPPTSLGGWPATFPGFATAPWQAPEAGWHVDGIQFHHHIDSRVQGLLPIFLFSDIAPESGGTCIRPGSHKVTARILADAEPEGLDVHTLARLVTEQAKLPALEMTGNAGDVALLHPFMLHAASLNTGTSVRFICNPCISLHEPMNLAREDEADYSPLERSIVNALAQSAVAA